MANHEMLRFALSLTTTELKQKLRLYDLDWRHVFEHLENNNVANLIQDAQEIEHHLLQISAREDHYLSMINIIHANAPTFLKQKLFVHAVNEVTRLRQQIRDSKMEYAFCTGLGIKVKLMLHSPSKYHDRPFFPISSETVSPTVQTSMNDIDSTASGTTPEHLTGIIEVTYPSSINGMESTPSGITL